MNDMKTKAIWQQPEGLAQLFFVELWERFAYYGIRSLVFLYMLRSALALDDVEAYRIYGAYTTLVYLAPTWCAALITKLIPGRQSLILGALFMLGGMQLLAIEQTKFLYASLGLICIGTGFFKPVISAKVGALYARDDRRRGPGFVLYYLGINLGAALAPLVCGYIGEEYGWGAGFVAASLGMMAGLLIYVGSGPIRGFVMAAAVILVSRQLVLAAAAESAKFWLVPLTLIFVLLALQAFAFWAWRHLNHEPKLIDSEPLRDPVAGLTPEETCRPAVWKTALVALCGLILAAGSALTISGFKGQTEDGKALRFNWDEEAMAELHEVPEFKPALKHTLLDWQSTVGGRLIIVTLALFLIYMVVISFLSKEKPWRGVLAIFVLALFSTSFWAVFEYSGMALRRVGDFHVDRVAEERQVTEEDVGKFMHIEITQEQIGYEFRRRKVDGHRMEELRADYKGRTSNWWITEEHVGMGIAEAKDELPAYWFQSINPLGIIVLGLIMVALWMLMIHRGIRIGTLPTFALSFVCMAIAWGSLSYSLEHADHRGFIPVALYVLVYLTLVVGEILLSPVGMARVTRLAPRGQVPLFLGFWFLMTTLSGPIANFLYQLKPLGKPSEEFLESLPDEALGEQVLTFKFAFYACLCLAGACALLTLVMRRLTDPEFYPNE